MFMQMWTDTAPEISSSFTLCILSILLILKHQIVDEVQEADNLKLLTDVHFASSASLN